jgi:hypothetical protein
MASTMQPVEIEILGQCVYKMKPCGACGKAKSHPSHRKKGGTCVFQRRLGCATCGKPKSWAGHLGAPESFNAMAGRDPNVYRAAVDRWADALRPLLATSGLPTGLERVVVEGEVSFGDGRERDQGNHRVIVEKALGDALVRDGYLPADTWSRYEFGGLQRRDEPGVSRTRLLLFPSAEVDGAQLSF